MAATPTNSPAADMIGEGSGMVLSGKNPEAKTAPRIHMSYGHGNGDGYGYGDGYGDGDGYGS